MNDFGCCTNRGYLYFVDIPLIFSVQQIQMIYSQIVFEMSTNLSATKSGVHTCLKSEICTCHVKFPNSKRLMKFTLLLTSKFIDVKRNFPTIFMP